MFTEDALRLVELVRAWLSSSGDSSEAFLDAVGCWFNGGSGADESSVRRAVAPRGAAIVSFLSS